MGMRGELGTFSAAEILQLIGSQEKSGVLQVRSKGRTAVLFFDSGKIISARDRRQAGTDPFLSHLLENGEITLQDVHRVLEAKKSEGGDVLEILLQMKLVDEPKLGELLSSYALQIVTSIVKWETGTYEFTASNDGVPDKSIGKPVRLEPVLMEALRRKDEVEQIRRFLPGLDTVLDRAVSDWKSLPLEEDDFAVLDLVDGIRTIDQIIEESKIDEVETLDILEKLFALGIVSIAETKTPREAKRAISPTKSVAAAVILLAASAALRFGVPQVGQIPSEPGHDLRVVVEDFIESREIENIHFALDAYKMLNGAYPDGLEYLVSSGLLKPDQIRSQNGTLYRYGAVSSVDSYTLSR